jgi:hypothetical protein
MVDARAALRGRSAQSERRTAYQACGVLQCGQATVVMTGASNT